MTKRFLFIVPPSVPLSERRSMDANSVWNRIVHPYGALSIISYVNSHIRGDVEFRILDLRTIYYAQEDEQEADLLISEAIRDAVDAFHPDFVGISALFNTSCIYMDLIAEALKTARSTALVVIGGGLATVLYQEILDEFDVIDMAIIAEGEIPMLSLLASDNPMQEYRRNPAIVTRESLRERRRPEPQFVENLDEIPMADLSYLDESRYDGRVANLVTSKGCPFNCVFCAAYLMSGKRIRFHSARRVNEDVQRYYDQGCRHYNIFDENFFYDSKRARNILNTIVNLNTRGDVSVNFPSGVMVAHIDEHVSALLRLLNVHELSLALESGSERVLKDIIGKPVTRRKFEKAVHALRKHGIRVRTFIVTGLPGESDQDRRETVEYLKKVGVDWASINIAVPLYGSRLYEICRDNGYLKEFEVKSFRMGTAYIETPECSAEHLKEQAYLMNLEVNFVGNHAMRAGNCSEALADFEKIAASYPNHAFAHYYAAKCCEELGSEDGCSKHMHSFREIVNRDQAWRRYAERFSLGDHPLESCMRHGHA